MKLGNLKKMTLVGVLGLFTLLGTSTVADAQWTSDRDRRIRQQERKIEKQQRKLERQQQRYNAMRYRVYRNGSYYNTDERGAQILRQAVNNGYQQGFRAGQYDAQRGNRFGYNSQSMYRSGTYGWSYVDQSQYRYYFQQGFQRGYQDGYYRRNQYGSNGMNVLGSILQSILNISQY